MTDNKMDELLLGGAGTGVVCQVKSKNGMAIFVLSALLLVFGIAMGYDNFKNKEDLVYDYKKSYLNGFYFTGDYAVLECRFVIKNNSNKDLVFGLSADVSAEPGIFSEKTAIATKKESLEQEKFTVGAGATEYVQVYLKAKKGSSTQKKDRLPPKKVVFHLEK